MSSKIEAIEKIFDEYLLSSSDAWTGTGANNALKAVQKLPSGIDKEKLVKVFRKLNSLSIFKYANHLPYEYMTEINVVVKELMPKYSSERIRLHALHHTIESINGIEEFHRYVELTNFFKYIQSFSTKINNSKKFELADKYITDWVLKEAENTLLTMDYASKDHNTCVLFMYVLAKSNSKECVNVVNFQDRERAKLDRKEKLNALLLSLEKLKELEHVKEAYLLLCEKLQIKPK